MSDAISRIHPQTSCLTTYIFNPADSLAPSPERREDVAPSPGPSIQSPHTNHGYSNHHHGHAAAYQHGAAAAGAGAAAAAAAARHQYHVSNASTATIKSVTPETLQLTLDRKSLGHCNYMAEYDHEVVVLKDGSCAGGGSGGGGKIYDKSFGPLYTITNTTTATNTEERTYDEPCTGDLHRRSWLCCPGGETTTTRTTVGTLVCVEPPPLLDKTNCKDGDTVIAAQPLQNGGGAMNGFCRSPYERLQEQLDEQARSYEEQLTELHSVIAELTRKLHHQRAMAIQEEEEMLSDISTSVHDDSLTCPLEVSELDHGDLSDVENKRPHILLAESPRSLPSPPKLHLPPPPPSPFTLHPINPHPPLKGDDLILNHHHPQQQQQQQDPEHTLALIMAHSMVEPLSQEILGLQRELAEANRKLGLASRKLTGQTTGRGGAGGRVRDGASDEKSSTNGSGSTSGSSDRLEKNGGGREEQGQEEVFGLRGGLEFINADEAMADSPRFINDIKYSNIVPIHRTPAQNHHHHPHPHHNTPNHNPITASPPPTSQITRMAARRRLRRTTESEVQQNNMDNTVRNMDAAANTADVDSDDVKDAINAVQVAEQVVDDILQQCDVESDKMAIQIEVTRLRAKLEHSRAQNSVALLTLSETKAHCDRLALLCGKYESNAIALRLALGISDRAIEAYDVLLALLETELTMNDKTQASTDNRNAAETVAKQLLHYLDSLENSDLLLSPWQSQMYTSPNIDSNAPWTTVEENKLREHVSKLKLERSCIEGTCVSFESLQIESAPTKSSASIHEYRKFDMEMAVLIQELTYCREEKCELLKKLFQMEKEITSGDLKIKYSEGQQKAQSAAIKNLQGQLKDTEALLAIATQQRERGFTEAEHAEGVEKELVLALAREARLKVRLQELVSTLDQVTKNAEVRLNAGREIVEDLRLNNATLTDTVDKNNKKYQTKYKKMEQQMASLVERHTAQVQNLQLQLASLEKPTPNSYGDSKKLGASDTIHI